MYGPTCHAYRNPCLVAPGFASSEVAVHYLDLHESGERSFQFDRNGKSLLSGGDNDLAGCACDVGFGVGLIASLKLMRLISPE
jgi:hypothetical protein